MEKQEEWRPVEGYEGLYEVSDFGRVRSLPRNTTKGGILKPSPNERGYLQVGLRKNGKRETCLVHRLVMRTFKGECPEGYEVDHIDWNPENNMLDNLRYLPAKENGSRKSPEWRRKNAEAVKKRAADPEWLRKNAEAVKRRSQNQEWQRNVSEAVKKLHKDPEYLKKNAEAVRKARSKPVNQYTLDGEFVKTWPSATEAAKEFGINLSGISACCNGKRKRAGGYLWRMEQ